MRMRRSSTRRLRRHIESSRRGIASAVATMFSIMIVALMLASYLAVQFPNQMEDEEFQHALLVENQFRQLQGDIYAEVSHPGQHVVMTTPITLGSKGVPPLGPGSTGTLSPPLARAENATFGMAFGQVNYEPPTWGQGNLCSVVAGSCTQGGSQGKCTPVQTYNFSGTDQTWTVSLNGANNCYFLNFTGNHNVISVSAPSQNFQYMVILVEGDYNFFSFSYNGGAGSPNIFLFGQRDSYNVSMSGNHKVANTTFIGFQNGTIRCPLLNLSATDTYNVTISGGNSNQQNLTWFNALGYNSNANLVKYQKGYVQYQNKSLPIGCAWYVNGITDIFGGNFGGLSAQLSNRYSPVVSVNYEEGAVIVGNPINDSTMLSGPQLSLMPAPGGGYYANLTLIDFQVQNLTVEQGQGVVGVQTWLVSESTEFFPTGTFSNLSNGNYVLTNPQYLNVTTNFPGAWSTWARGYSSVVTSRPYIHDCFVQYNGFNSCQVSIPFVDAGVYLTVATVGLAFSSG